MYCNKTTEQKGAEVDEKEIIHGQQWQFVANRLASSSSTTTIIINGERLQVWGYNVHFNVLIGYEWKVV